MVKSKDNYSGKNNIIEKFYSIVIINDGSMRVIFGDGTKGAQPPAGNIIAEGYREGSGKSGEVPNEKMKRALRFSSKAKAIEFLFQKIMSEINSKSLEEQGNYFVYLNAWDRDLTSVEDSTIRENSHGGPNTGIRTEIKKIRKRKPP